MVDARGATLASHFEVPASDRIRLVVEDAGATYPIVIDPLLTGTPDATIERNLANALITSVASAGDVNGDGYQDLIVGSCCGVSGGGGENAALIFHGGPTGVTSGGPAQANTVLTADVTLRFGFSVASAGDVNGDGYGDVLVGAVNYTGPETNEGAAFLYLGGPTGIPNGGPDTASARLESNQLGALFGNSLASAGDVNGDGYDDILVGARAYDNGQTNEGVVFLYLGSASAIASGSPATASALFESNQTGARLGTSVASAGDVNADGYADVIMGADAYDNGQLDEGSAFIFLGSAAGIASGNPATAATRLESNQTSGGSGAPLMGTSVASAGDVDGDGYGDVIVTAPGYDNGEVDEGAAFIFRGSATGVADGNSTTAATILETNLVGGLLRMAAPAGDLNGDGYGEVILGAENINGGGTNRGAAFAVFGSATGIASGSAVAAAPLGPFPPVPQDDARFGSSVASGDFDGDGFGDLVVAAGAYDAGQIDEGVAFVYRGGAKGLDSGDTAALADATLTSLGTTLAFDSAGDVNGDGYGDLIIGSPDHDCGSSIVGAAFVFLGSATGVVDGPLTAANAVLCADQVASGMGIAVSGAGDVNGDGYDDVLVGAPFYDAGELNEGAAFVFLGSAAGIASANASAAHARIEGNQANPDVPLVFGLGHQLDSAGDVNGDGFGDILVGSVNHDNGQTNEGILLVFHGSATGIPSGHPGTAPTLIESDLTNGALGARVASAGDLNGDGFDDVAGIGFNESSVLTVHVFHGSASGIPNGNRSSAQGTVLLSSLIAHLPIAPAADVNGDGFGDLAVSAHGQNPNVGIFHGTVTGIGLGRTLANADSMISDFVTGTGATVTGTDVASAGDLNGDGYADIVLPGVTNDNNNNWESSSVFVYYGSATGITTGTPATANASLTGMPGAPFVSGRFSDPVQVSVAGDVNGDGFGDFLVRRQGWTTSYVFHGGSDGRSQPARQRRGSGAVLVARRGSAQAPDRFGIEMRVRSPRGREKAAVEVEACPPHKPFGDVGCVFGQTTGLVDLGTSGASIGGTIAGLATDTSYSWRARPLFTSAGAKPLVAVPVFRAGPWVRLNGNAGPRDVRTVPEPAIAIGLAAGVALLVARIRSRRRGSAARSVGSTRRIDRA